MILSISGFGYTGSGAVKDYLTEFETVSISKEEFNFLCAVDGLVDLGKAITYPSSRTGSSIYAIQRFIDFAKRKENYFCKTYKIKKKVYRKLLKDFIESITAVEWKDFLFKKGFFNRVIVDELLSQRIVPHIERISKKQISIFPMKTVRLSGPSCHFYESARVFIQQILSLMGLNNKELIVLDQAFAANNPQACFPFFDDAKVIIVDKDPRDLYVFAREMLPGYDHFMPINDVKSFVAYYKTIRVNQPYNSHDSRILIIRFEDMIFNYEKTTQKIKSFLKLPEHTNTFKFFDPSVSIGNTQLFKKFPKYAQDVQYIESELKDFLYDFDSTDIDNNDKKMFV